MKLLWSLSDEGCVGIYIINCICFCKTSNPDHFCPAHDIVFTLPAKTINIPAVSTGQVSMHGAALHTVNTHFLVLIRFNGAIVQKESQIKCSRANIQTRLTCIYEHAHTLQSKVYSTKHANGSLTSHFIAHQYCLYVNSLQHPVFAGTDWKG